MLDPAVSAQLITQRTFGLLAVGGAALAVAALGRRRLAAGVGEGLFIAALSVLLLAGNLPAAADAPIAANLAALFTGLAVVWHLGARWIERYTAAGAAPTGSSEPGLRSTLAGHGVVLCGLAVAGLALRRPGSFTHQERLGLTLCLVLLLALTLRPWLSAGRDRARYGMLALAFLALGLWAAPAQGRAASLVSRAAAIAVVLGLVAALLPILAHWRYRRRVWHSEPERLLDEPRPLTALWSILAFVSTAMGVLVLFAPPTSLGPVTVGLAALTASIAGHQRGSQPAGELGLALAGAAVVVAARSWLSDFGYNALLGITLASGWMLWLARFWDQQLHDGRAWTTAGRLIPAARRLGQAGALGCVAVAVGSYGAEAPSLWGTLLTIAALSGLAALLLRGAMTDDDPPQVLAAGALLLVAVLPVLDVLRAMEFSPAWGAVACALAALLLAARLGPARPECRTAWAAHAYLGGFLPVTAACLLALSVRSAAESVPVLVALACWVVAGVLRWARRPTGAR